jgi:hypothetical protein
MSSLNRENRLVPQSSAASAASLKPNSQNEKIREKLAELHKIRERIATLQQSPILDNGAELIQALQDLEKCRTELLAGGS